MTQWKNKSMTLRSGKPAKVRTDGTVWQICEEKIVYGPYYTPMDNFIAQLKESSKGMIDTEVRAYGNQPDGEVEIRIYGWREVNEFEKPYLPEN